MKQYRNKKWLEFRKEVISLDGHACTVCDRTDHEVVLQVHHKKYLTGHLPWEYPFSDCETLCKGCHAREHGEIRPNIGWELSSQEDLGGLFGNCELCGSTLRHAFLVCHQHWEPMIVGTYCCDNLTGTKEASNHRKNLERKKRFIASKRWEKKSSGVYLTQSKIRIGIIPTNNGKFRIMMDRNKGKLEFESESKAKEIAFEKIISGEAQSYLNKLNKSA